MDFEKFIEEVKSRIKDFLPEKYADAGTACVRFGITLSWPG